MLAPGPVVYGIYKLLVTTGIMNPLVISDNQTDLSAMVSGFSYTMLGFLATIITILFNVTSSRNYQRYRSTGRLDVFFSLYYLSILSLVITCILSLFGFSKNHTYLSKVLVMIFIDDLFLIAAVTVTIISLFRRA